MAVNTGRKSQDIVLRDTPPRQTEIIRRLFLQRLDIPMGRFNSIYSGRGLFRVVGRMLGKHKLLCLLPVLLEQMADMV